MTDTNKNIDSLFSNIDQRSKLSVKEKSWLKLEKKLDRRRYRRNLKNYRNLAIAAVSLFLISVVLLMSTYTNNKNQAPLFDQHEAIVYQLNDLESATNSHYVRKNIEILAEKYLLAGIQ